MSYICEHDRQKHQCKECLNDNELLDFYCRRSVFNHRHSDLRKNLYDPNLHISTDWMKDEIEYQNHKCIWCQKKLKITRDKHCPDMPTVDRIYNERGHWKSNCVIACYDCNVNDGLKQPIIKTAEVTGRDIQDITNELMDYLKELRTQVQEEPSA